jgi:competence protein ComGF
MCSVSAQKYTDTYIKEANKVALAWLNDLNHDQHKDAYKLLSKEVKQSIQQEDWIEFMNDLMFEFGDIEDRKVTQTYFQSEIEQLEDGFYVVINYEVNYKKTKEHTENLLLKQNDKAKWEILYYNYEFKNKEDDTPNNIPDKKIGELD